MKSIANPQSRRARSQFGFSLSLTLMLLTGLAAAGLVSRGTASSGGPSHAGSPAPLAGENCGSALGIPPSALPFTDESSTVGAVNDIDPGLNGCVSGLGPEVVYSFTPSATDTYVAGVTPTGFDASLYVITNCSDPAGSCVGGSNDRGFAQSESLRVTLNAGTTYFIVVDSPQQNGQGTFHFALRRGLPANDSCATPTVVEPSRLPFQTSGTTFGATNDSNPGTPCLRTGMSGSGPDVAYAFTPASGQNYDVSVTPAATFDVSLYIVTNCLTSSSCRGTDLGGPGDTENLRRNLNAGTTYFIVVDGVEGDSGDFTLTIVPTIPMAPAPPTNLTATAVNPNQIDLSWQDNAADELGFRISRSLDGSNFSEIASVGPNVTTFSDTGLTPETTYFYLVVAFNNFGNSAPTNVAGATTPPSPVPVFPVLNVDPASIDFGTVSGSLSKPLTISNGGGSDLIVSSIQDPAAPFSIVNKPQTPLTIPPAQSVVITVRFAPLAAQGFSGQLSIQSNDPLHPNVAVLLQGIGIAVPVPNLDVTATVVDFPNGSSTKPFQVMNTGNADLFITSINQPAAPFAVSGLPALPKTLKPDEKFAFTIGFSPVALGVFSSDFRIVSNDPDSLLTVIHLRGTSTTPPPSMPGLEFRKKAIRFVAAGSNVVNGAVMIVDGTQTFALTRDGDFFTVGKNVRSAPGNFKPKNIFTSGSTHFVQVVNPDGGRSVVQPLTR